MMQPNSNINFFREAVYKEKKKEKKRKVNQQRLRKTNRDKKREDFEIRKGNQKEKKIFKLEKGKTKHWEFNGNIQGFQNSAVKELELRYRRMNNNV